jgi:hypothetical protein
LICLFPGIYFRPDNFALAFISLFNGSIEDTPRCPPNIPPGAIPFDKWNDDNIWNLEFPITD